MRTSLSSQAIGRGQNSASPNAERCIRTDYARKKIPGRTLPVLWRGTRSTLTVLLSQALPVAETRVRQVPTLRGTQLPIRGSALLYLRVRHRFACPPDRF